MNRRTINQATFNKVIFQLDGGSKPAEVAQALDLKLSTVRSIRQARTWEVWTQRKARKLELHNERMLEKLLAPSRVPSPTPQSVTVTGQPADESVAVKVIGSPKVRVAVKLDKRGKANTKVVHQLAAQVPAKRGLGDRRLDTRSEADAREIQTLRSKLAIAEAKARTALESAARDHDLREASEKTRDVLKKANTELQLSNEQHRRFYTELTYFTYLKAPVGRRIAKRVAKTLSLPAGWWV